MNKTSSYLLLDTALADSIDCKPWLKKKRRPAWVSPIYDDSAIVVSPVLIDIERAVLCNRVAEMMMLANSLYPALHASIIETALTLQELTTHLKKFIFVVTSGGEELTFRFADCVVLSVVAQELEQASWNALAGPISRWMVHQLDGNLATLRTANDVPVASLPLVISEEEERSIPRELATHQLLHNISLADHQLVSSFSLQERCNLVRQAAEKYAESRLTETAALIQLAHFALKTRGAILTDASLPGILLEQCADYRGKRLHELSAKYG